MAKNNTLKQIETIAKLLDNQFKIGPFKFGLDPIIGLIPGIGDFVPLAFSLYIIRLAHKERVSTLVLQQMIANTVIDFIIGTVPIAGDIGDFFFKSSARNADLLKKELNRQGKLDSDPKVEEGEIIRE